jgi:hypothetical protein
VYNPSPTGVFIFWFTTVKISDSDRLTIPPGWFSGKIYRTPWFFLMNIGGFPIYKASLKFAGSIVLEKTIKN